MEGIYFGVPMVGMPIFIDQGDVLVRMKERGIALGFNKDNTTATEIYESLREVITNPKFKENALALSSLMRDVRETPFERAIDLLEYLIRHKGAEHLKLSSRKLNYFQYFSIDTITFLLLIFFLLTYCQYLILKKVCRALIAYVSPICSAILTMVLKETGRKSSDGIPVNFKSRAPLVLESSKQTRLSSQIELELYRKELGGNKFDESKKII